MIAMVTIRRATTEDSLDVRRLLDAAMLEPGDVEASVERGDVLIAVSEGPSPDDDGETRLHGALVLHPRADGAHVTAIAVRRRRRDRGIGTALVEAALERESRLTATFDSRVQPFYESLGWDIERIGDDRFCGVTVASE